MLALVSTTSTVERWMVPEDAVSTVACTGLPSTMTESVSSSTTLPSGRPSAERSRETVPEPASTWSMLISLVACAGIATASARNEPEAAAASTRRSGLLMPRSPWS